MKIILKGESYMLSLKHLNNFRFSTLLAILGLSLALFSGCSSSGNSSDSTSNVTMSGDFQISVSPDGVISSSQSQKSISTTEYTVTSLDIAVANNSTQAVVGSYHWIPTTGATSYNVPISGYGQYEIVVYQIAEANGYNQTSTSRATVNIRPMIVTVVTIIPGASLTVKVGAQLQGVASNSSGTFVAVGDRGKIISSTDAVNWIQRNSGTSNSFVNIRWSGNKGLFVAYGDKGTIVTSPDGITWTRQNSNTSNRLYNVAENSSKILLVGDNGTIVTSSDGINWIIQTSNTTSNLNGCVWNAAASLFAVDGDNGVILQSADGSIWTTVQSPTVYKVSSIYSNNSKFLVKGFDSFGNYEFYTSSGLDLTTPSWSAGYIFSNTASSLSSLYFGSMIAVSVCGNGLIYTSANSGLTWTLQNSGTTDQLNKVNYISAVSKYFAVGNNGTIVTSSDGINWTVQTSNTQNDLKQFSYSNLTYVVIGNNDTILTSADGVTWTSRTYQ
jgi:hypothetical protein